MKSKLALAIGTTIAAMCMSAPVLAETATTTVNVRSGPGTSYRVVGVLQAGDYVDVNRCTGGWCQITMRGPDGWVSSRFLSSDRPVRRYPDRPSRPPVRDNNANTITFSIGANGPNISIGNPDNPNDHRRYQRYDRWRNDQCFRRDGQIYCPVN